MESQKQALKVLMDGYVDLNKSRSTSVGEKSALLASSLDYMQRKIRDLSKKMDGGDVLELIVPAYVQIIRAIVENHREAHHMMFETKRFLKSEINLQLKRIEK